MLHGKPQANIKIKRGTLYEERWRWDTTRTDTDGHFYFAEKVISASPVLYSPHSALQLTAIDNPNKGHEQVFFSFSRADKLQSPSIDLLTDGLLCELSADYEISYLKYIEYSIRHWHAFESQCRFLHADKVIVSKEERDAAEFELSWDDIHNLLPILEQKAATLHSDQYAREDIKGYVESGLSTLQRIAELEPSAEKRNTLPQLKQQIQSYLELLDKEELP